MSEWIKCGMSWMQFKDEGLNLPGVQVEVLSDTDPTKSGVWLIGNINELGGKCDDCMSFREVSIVNRYRTLVTEDTQNG